MVGRPVKLMDLVEEVREFVEAECKKPSSHYGYEPFPNHFMPMVNYAQQLAEELGADREIVTIAAWLHDIGSIKHGREDHHLTGAKIAEEKLKELDYPPEKIKRVKKCILNHRSSQDNERESIEEKIIAEADAMSNFDNIAGIFKAAFVYEEKTQQEAQQSVRDKLERKWQQLHFAKSKELIRPKYKAALLLLSV